MMAFGVSKKELVQWKKEVREGEEIVFLTHFWLDKRFPDSTSVTKAGCSDIEKLIDWGKKYGLSEQWIHHDPEYPHFDLFGEIQREVLQIEGKWDQLVRFKLN